MKLLLIFISLVSIFAQGPEAPVLGYWPTRNVINTNNNCLLDSLSIGGFVAELSDENGSDLSDTIFIGFNQTGGYYEDYFPFKLLPTEPSTWQWKDTYLGTGGTINLTYSSFAENVVLSFSNSTTNCSYSFQKEGFYLSGFWLFDTITEGSHSSLPSSINITNFNNVYMNISATYPNSTTTSEYFYYSPNVTFSGLGVWVYNSTTDTFFCTQDSRGYYAQALYSKNGSLYYSGEGFVGSWNNPQYASGDMRSECCAPYSVQIFNNNASFGEVQLPAQLFFDQTITDLKSCQFLTLYEEGDSVPLTFTGSLNRTSYSIIYSYQGPDFGTYSFSLASPDELFLNFGNQCNFTMTQTSSNPTPNPKTSNALSSKMIVFVFVLVAIFMN